MQEGIIFHTVNYANSAACEAAALDYEAALDLAHGEDWTLVYQNYVTPGAKFCVLIDGDDDVALVPPPEGTTREEVGDEWYPPPVVAPPPVELVAKHVESEARKKPARKKPAGTSKLGKADRKRRAKQ